MEPQIFAVFVEELGFIGAILQEGLIFKIAAAVIFGAASITDYLDGYIAKKYNLVSKFGKLMDPVADKFLLLAAFFIFTRMDIVEAWMFILIAVREIFITGWRLVVVQKGKEKYDPFLAKKPEEEAAMWKEFVSFVESHLDVPIYHYGHFETDVINRFAAKYGCSDLVRDALRENMIDVIEVIRRTVVFPLTFYSLKDIAAYVGFHWRSDDASGANSVLWFESWMKNGDKATLEKILDYNEDDVKATRVVKDWLVKHT